MIRLYILRHGIAVPHGTEGIADDDRPLTEKGEKRMRRIGRGLRRLSLGLDRVVTSPLPRALRTAEIASEKMGISERPEIADDLRAGVSAGSIRDWLASRAEDRLMIVGHNPSLSELVGLLASGGSPGPIVELAKGGVAALEASPEGGWTLDWLARPRLLIELAR